MDLTAFEEYLDRWGGDLNAWPLETKVDAVAFLESSGAARAALKVMTEIESVLRATIVVPSVDAGAMAATAMRHHQHRPISRWMLQTRRAGLATAAAIVLFLGLFLGQTTPSGEDGPDRVLAIAFDSTGAADVD
jgi:hypothetical protein